MPNYIWKGKGRTGQTQEGILLADSQRFEELQSVLSSVVSHGLVSLTGGSASRRFVGRCGRGSRLAPAGESAAGPGR